MPKTQFKRGFPAPFFGILALALVLCLYIAATFADRGHYTGDGPSNDRVWKRALNFSELGFWRLRFVPLEERGEYLNPTGKLTGLKTPFYTHYPAGPDLAQGLLLELGFDTRFSHQLFSIGISMVALVLLWLALSRMVSQPAALAGLGLFVLGPGFLFFADSLYDFPWMFLLRCLFLKRIVDLYADLREGVAVELPRRWAEFFAIGLVASWFSIDAVPALCLLGFGFAGVFSKSIGGHSRWKLALLFMIAAPVAEILGFTLHILKNGLVLGGIGPAFHDIFSAFLARSGQKVAEGGTLVYNPVKHAAKWLLGIQWFYTLPLVAVAAAGWIGRIRESRDRFWIWLGAGALLAGIFWQFFMRQHSSVHAFTYRHAEMFVLLGSTLFFDACVKKLPKLVAVSVSVLVVVFVALHAVLAIAQIEGRSVKQSLITALLKAEEQTAWACQQMPRLSGSTELEGAKQVVQDFVQNVQRCESVAPDATTGIRGRVAELVLFWR